MAKCPIKFGDSTICNNDCGDDAYVCDDGELVCGKCGRFFKKWIEIGVTPERYLKLQRELEKQGTGETAKNIDSCPCLFTEPCTPDCTCVNPYSSHGCLCCCSYGNPEQRKATAERIRGQLMRD